MISSLHLHRCSDTGSFSTIQLFQSLTPTAAWAVGRRGPTTAWAAERDCPSHRRPVIPGAARFFVVKLGILSDSSSYETIEDGDGELAESGEHCVNPCFQDIAVTCSPFWLIWFAVQAFHDAVLDCCSHIIGITNYMSLKDLHRALNFLDLASFLCVSFHWVLIVKRQL